MAALDAAMLWLSNWGIIIPILCVLLTRDRKVIAGAILSFLITYGVTDVLKLAVMRPRPFIAGDAQLIGAPAEGWSFPSKHSSLSFSLATSALLGRRVLGWVALVFAALVAYSRVYLGVHYLSDVIIGALLGSGIAYCVHYVMQRLEQHKRSKKR